jgi:hypothetical protein
MFRVSVARLGGGGHGPLFPITKPFLATVERKVPAPPPKGYRYETTTAPQREGKWQLFGVQVHHKKKVKIPESAACTVASLTAHVSHKKLPLSSIALANIQEKERCEKAIKHRDFLAHKQKVPDQIPRTGEVIECDKFFERWVLDHRCILNDNPLGVKPVKMPWVSQEEFEGRHGILPPKKVEAEKK